MVEVSAVFPAAASSVDSILCRYSRPTVLTSTIPAAMLAQGIHLRIGAWVGRTVRNGFDSTIGLSAAPDATFSTSRHSAQLARCANISSRSRSSRDPSARAARRSASGCGPACWHRASSRCSGLGSPCLISRFLFLRTFQQFLLASNSQLASSFRPHPH